MRPLRQSLAEEGRSKLYSHVEVVELIGDRGREAQNNKRLGDLPICLREGEPHSDDLTRIALRALSEDAQ